MTTRLLLAYLLAVIVFASSPSTAPPVYGDASGQTGMGYGWTDNHRPDAGTTFQWTDIAQSGNRVDQLSSCDDCFVGDFGIGFDFPFYGESYSSVGINSNGTLQFVNTDDFFGPATLPTEHFTGPVLFPLWGDWDPRSSGNIYVKMIPSWPGGGGQRAFVVQWDDVENWDCRPGNNATWQVVLLDDGRFIFEYLDTELADLDCDHGADMTIGIQQGLGECFLTYSFRFASVPNETAILWSPQPSACVAADATPTPVDAAPSVTPGQAPTPGQDGSHGQGIVDLPIDGTGPAGSNLHGSSHVAGELYFAVVGVALLLTGLGIARFPGWLGKTKS